MCIYLIKKILFSVKPGLKFKIHCNGLLMYWNMQSKNNLNTYITISFRKINLS